MGLLIVAMSAGANAQGRKDRSAALSGNPAEFFGTDNYPPEAIRKGEQGRVVARLSVAADGHVTACDLDQSSGSPSLDSTTCDIALKRVAFTPARDRRGRAISSTYVLPVRWVLPDENAPTPRASFDQRLTLDISADDKLLGCQMYYKQVAYPGDNPACAVWGKLAAVQLHGLKAELGGAHATVTIQRVVQFQGAEAIPLVHVAQGQKLVRLTRTLLDVLPDGTIGNARVVEQIGVPDFTTLVPPDKTLGLFAAAPDKKDEVTLIDALSVAPVPVTSDHH